MKTRKPGVCVLEVEVCAVFPHDIRNEIQHLPHFPFVGDVVEYVRVHGLHSQ